MSQPEVASDPDKFQRLAKEASSIQTQVDQFKLYQEKEEALVDTRALLRDSEGDAEMTELAQMEITEIEGDLEVRALTALHACMPCMHVAPHLHLLGSPILPVRASGHIASSANHRHSADTSPARVTITRPRPPLCLPARPAM